MTACPSCGEETVTTYGQTTHTVAGRGERWSGTLVELTRCNPDVDNRRHVGLNPEHQEIQP